MKKRILNETAPDIMPRNNIVVIQCLFRNMLTANKLNIASQIISPKLRRGLDFEMYYQLDGEVVKRLLSSTLLVTNCKNWRELCDMDQIVDILAPYEPFACFLTDSKGDQITGDEMSPESQDILRQRSAQGSNFSIFRFSFITAGYDAVLRKLETWQDTGDLVSNDYVRNMKNGKVVKIYHKNDETDVHWPNELGQIYPFMVSGYWSGFSFNPGARGWEGRGGAFVKNSDIAKPFIPQLTYGIWDRRPDLMFKSIIHNAEDVEDVQDGKLTRFIETAVSTAMRSNRDLRTKLRESDWIEFTAHMLDESMCEK